MFNEGDSILLLFTGGIDICEEKCDVMTTDKGHKASGIKMRTASLLFPTISGLVRILALVDGRIRDFCVVGPRRLFPGTFNPISYGIHLFLRYEVVRFIKRWTVPRTRQVPVVEIAICCHMDIATTEILDGLSMGLESATDRVRYELIKTSTFHATTKTSGASFLKQPCCFSARWLVVRRHIW